MMTASVIGTALSGFATANATALPPGVSYDASVHPLAPLTASTQQKTQAVEQIAESKLGTPYIWGHNEDRGQYGFDCSNFTAYVYHHALGYRMSGSSQAQYHSVGWPVPVQDMRPGDLLIFNQGGHVGIYIGNGTMIQEGGGLRKVGYLSVKPGSYWYKHLTCVKRMY
ncbi:MAG: C40 family peptidase [Alicyclobacillus sp.]|nr:C40 family peptidase [Alicyclobacillus sp.]